MKAWIIERRQQVLTADDMTAERIRGLIAEYDDAQAGAELARPNLIALVVSDSLDVTPAPLPASQASTSSEEAKREVNAVELVLVECDQCNRTFDADLHKARTHPHLPGDPKGRRTPCEQCDAAFYDIARHVERMHPRGDELARRRREAGLV